MTQSPINLLNYSNLNCLQSLLKIKDIINYSLNNSYSYAICTDIEQVLSFFEFNKLCKENNLTPIYGITKTINSTEWLILANNQSGIDSLIQINNKGWSNIFFQSPSLTFILLNGLTQTTPLNYYTTHPDQINSINIKKNYFLSKEDFHSFCALRSIDLNISYNESLSKHSHLTNNHLNSINTNLTPIEQTNLNKILSSIEPYSNPPTLPLLHFKNPQNIPNKDYLWNQLITSLNSLKNINKEIYLSRLKHEYNTIIKLNYEDFFLIISDLINYGISKNITFGFGRGSSTGSLVSYLLNITKIDPILYKLSFSRFLNIHTRTTPDIDLDCPDIHKEELITYLNNKYSSSHLPKLITYQKLKLKLCFNLLSKSLSIPDWVTEEITSSIPFDQKENLELLSPSHPFSSKYKQKYPLLFSLIPKIYNTPKQYGLHPAGLIMNQNTHIHYPTTTHNKQTVLLIDHNQIPHLNLIKFDLLSLKNLTIIEKIEQNILKYSKKTISHKSLNLSDQTVWNTLIPSNTTSIFQLESPLMSKLIETTKPRNIHSLANLLALCRPGAKEQYTSYNTNTPNPILSKYFKSILSPTNYLILFQEQVTEIIQEVTNYSQDQSHIFCNIISKKKSIPPNIKNHFFNSGLKNNYSNNDLNIIWNYLKKFSIYGFNKSHAYAYAHLTYYILWLKHHFPKEYFLTQINESNNIKHYKDSISHNINIKLPSINHSLQTNTIHNNTIYLGFNNISNFPPSLSNKLITIRNSLPNKEYTSTLLSLQLFINNNIPIQDSTLILQSNLFHELKDSNPNAYLHNLKEIYFSHKFPNLFTLKLTLPPPNSIKEYLEHKQTLFTSIPYDYLNSINFFQNKPETFTITGTIYNQKITSNNHLKLKLLTSTHISPWLYYYKSQSLINSPNQITLTIKNNKYNQILKWQEKTH